MQNNMFDPHIEGPSITHVVTMQSPTMIIWKGSDCDEAVPETSNANFRGVLNPFAASYIEAGERVCIQSTAPLEWVRFVVQSL